MRQGPGGDGAVTSTTGTTGSASSAGRGPSMASLVAAELFKIRSTRLWWGLLVGALLFTAFGAGFTAAFAGVEGSAGPGGQALPSVESPVLLRSVYGSGFSGAYIFALILGVTGMTGEYRYMTITPTFLGAPRRYPVVLAKLAAHLIAGLLYGVVCAVAAIVVGGVIIVAFKDGALGLTADGVPRAIGLSIVAVALWTLLGIGLGTLIKNQIAAILTGVLIAFLVEPLLGLLFSSLGWPVGKFLPTSASNALLSGFSGGAAQLDWWAGGLVLTGYALLFSVIGVASSIRRDIT